MTAVIGGQSIPNLPYWSRYFSSPLKSCILPRDLFVSVRTDLDSWNTESPNVPYRSVPHSACIIRRWALVSTLCSLLSLRPLIHSFTLFLLEPPLNLYAGAYLVRFLPVIDAHSIRLRTLVNFSDAVFVLNYFARRGIEKERWWKRKRGWENRARDSLVFIRVAELINFARPRRAARPPFKPWKEGSRRGEGLPLAASPIRHGYVTVVKLTLRDACHVWDWSSTVLFRRRHQRRQRQRESFSRLEYGLEYGAYTRANSGTLLCAGDRSTVKNCASCLLRGWESFFTVATSSSYMRSRDWRQRANAYATRNNITSWRKSWQTLPKQVNICHSLELYSRFTCKSTSKRYFLHLYCD